MKEDNSEEFLIVLLLARNNKRLSSKDDKFLIRHSIEVSLFLTWRARRDVFIKITKHVIHEFEWIHFLMMATTNGACLVGNPWWLFWHFRVSDFDFTSFIGIIMLIIIWLAYFGDEKITFKDAQKLSLKAFFNGSSGHAFVVASPKFNSDSSYVFYGV